MHWLRQRWVFTNSLVSSPTLTSAFCHPNSNSNTLISTQSTTCFFILPIDLFCSYVSKMFQSVQCTCISLYGLISPFLPVYWEQKKSFPLFSSAWYLVHAFHYFFHQSVNQQILSLFHLVNDSERSCQRHSSVPYFLLVHGVVQIIIKICFYLTTRSKLFSIF